MNYLCQNRYTYYLVIDVRNLPKWLRESVCNILVMHTHLVLPRKQEVVSKAE